MQARLTRILFATALSDASCHALCHAAMLARATGARIHVLHVQEPLSDDARVTLEMFVLNEGSRRDATERRAELAARVLQERQNAFWSAVEAHDPGARDLVASTEVVEGHAAEAILRRAQRIGAGLIVMGAHDHHGLSHSFLGTTAKRVLRRARIPTLIVPHVVSHDAAQTPEPTCKEDDLCPNY